MGWETEPVVTELSRRLHALRDAGRATCLLLWVLALGMLGLYVVTSPVTLTVVLTRILWVGCR